MAYVDHYQTLGGDGWIYIDDTSNHAIAEPYNFYIAVTAVGTAAAVLDYSAMNAAGYTWRGEGFDTDITIPLGATVYPWATGLTLASGACWAYRIR